MSGYTIIKSGRYDCTADAEEAIRRNRTSELVICESQEFREFPCVTFITILEIRGTSIPSAEALGKFILSLPLLEELKILINHGYLKGENPISNAISTHPSLRKVKVHDRYGYGIDTVMKRNPRITKYILGPNVVLDGDAIASLTGIRILWFEGYNTVLNHGVLLKFARNNPDIINLSVVAQSELEVIQAIGYLRSVNNLVIRCNRREWGEADRLVDVVRDALARCYPRLFVVHAGDKYYNRSLVWPGYAIRQDDFHRWNFTRSEPICDTAVHTYI